MPKIYDLKFNLIKPVLLLLCQFFTCWRHLETFPHPYRWSNWQSTVSVLVFCKLKSLHTILAFVFFLSLNLGSNGLSVSWVNRSPVENCPLVPWKTFACVAAKNRAGWTILLWIEGWITLGYKRCQKTALLRFLTIDSDFGSKVVSFSKVCKQLNNFKFFLKSSSFPIVQLRKTLIEDFVTPHVVFAEPEPIKRNK